MQVCRCGYTSLEKKFYSPRENICEDCYFIRREKNKFKKISDNPEKMAQKIIEQYRTYSKPTDVIAKCVQVDEQEIIDFLVQYGYYDNTKKRCGKCGEILYLSEFPKGQLNPSGWCKKCVIVYNNMYYIINSEEIKERTSEYYYNNWERMRMLNDEYQRLNKETLSIQRKVYAKIYNQRNRIAIRDYHRIYNEINKDLKQNWTSQRRAAKLNATVSWSNKQNIINIYKESVRLTKETDILHVVDHIDPLQSKLVCGLHIETNLQILTVSENASKSNKFIPYILDSEGNKTLIY